MALLNKDGVEAAAPFEVGTEVRTIKGARFWGVVVSAYRIETTLVFVGMRQPDRELAPEWRVDVIAVHPEFAGTIHVYPAAQLASGRYEQ